jgi:hypothetical protein
MRLISNFKYFNKIQNLNYNDFFKNNPKFTIFGSFPMYHLSLKAFQFIDLAPLLDFFEL